MQDVVSLKYCKSKSRVTARNARSWVKDKERNNVYGKQKKIFEEENKNKMNEKDLTILDKEDSIGSETITWKEISETLDRICLYFYSLFVLSLIVIFGAALHGVV